MSIKYRVLFKIATSCVLFAVILGIKTAFAGVIVLKTGEEVEGVIIKKTPEYVEVNVLGEPRRYPRAQIAKIRGRRAMAPKEVPIAKEGAQPSLNFSQALTLAAKGDLEAAQESFKEIFRQGYADDNVLEALNICEDVNQGKITKNQAIDIFKGLSHIDRHQYEEALKVFKDVIKRDPDNVDVYYNLASVYQYLGRYEEAIPYLKRVLELDPNDRDTLFELGSTYYGLGDHEEAIYYFKETINVVPDHAESYAFLGIAEYAKGRYEEGKDHLHRAKTLFKAQGNDQRAQEMQDLLDQLL